MIRVLMVEQAHSHCQVMEYVTTEERRKIAVHCHAGLGRTGLAIACFFVFTGTGRGNGRNGACFFVVTGPGRVPEGEG